MFLHKPHRLNTIAIKKTSKLHISVLLWGETIGHYNDVIMRPMVSQITSLTIVYPTFYSGSDQHQSSASLAFVQGIRRLSVNFPHKGPVTRKLFPFDDVIMWPMVPSTKDRWFQKRFHVIMRPYFAEWCITSETALLTEMNFNSSMDK